VDTRQRAKHGRICEIHSSDITKIRDSVKELREFRDAETEKEFLTRMKRREANVVQ